MMASDGQVARNGSAVLTPTEAERAATTLEVDFMAEEIGEFLAHECPCLDRNLVFLLCR